MRLAGQKHREITAAQRNADRMHNPWRDPEIRLALFITRPGDRLHSRPDRLLAGQYHLNISIQGVIFRMTLGLGLSLCRANMAEPRAALRLPASIIPGGECRQRAVGPFEDLPQCRGKLATPSPIPATRAHI